MFLLKLSDRPKEDLWADGIFVLSPPTGVDVDAPWHSQHQFKHSWPAQGNSSTFIRNAKVTLKMQFINPRQWTVFFILLWKINVIELESCQSRLLLRKGLIHVGSVSARSWKKTQRAMLVEVKRCMRKKGRDSTLGESFGSVLVFFWQTVNDGDRCWCWAFKSSAQPNQWPWQEVTAANLTGFYFTCSNSMYSCHVFAFWRTWIDQ